MTPRFLVDNCLSPALATMAREAGYHAMHLRDLKLSAKEDWDLVPVIAEGGWTFVTINPRDFRGSAREPGKAGEYRRLPEHNGLVCLVGPATGTDLRLQKALFGAVLEHIKGSADARGEDLACQVVEAAIPRPDAETIQIRRYDLPVGSWGSPELRIEVVRGDLPRTT